MIRSVRLALRRIRQTPWSSLAVIAVSGVGIAGVASVFSIVNTAWLRPLPNEWESRLVALVGVDPQRLVRWPVPPDVARDMRRGIGDQADIAGFDERSVRVRIADRSFRAHRTAIDESLLRILRVHPSSGRAPTRAEYESDAPVVVVGEDFWRRELGENAFREGVVLEVDGVRRAVIGLMPGDFRFRFRSSLWIPLPRAIESVSLVAEIRNGRSRGDIESLGDSALASGGRDRSRAGAWQLSVQDLQFRWKNRASMSLAKGFFVVSALLLLAAALTAGSLLQARTLRRERGHATALALGASRLDLVRDSIVEHTILAVSAAVLAIGLTSVLVRAVESSLPRDLPGWMEFGLDWRVLAFVSCVMATVIVLHALATAREMARIEPARAMAEADSALTRAVKGSRRGAAIVRWQMVLVPPLVVSASIVASLHAAVAWGGDAAGLDRSVDAFIRLDDARQEDLSVRTRLTDQLAERLGRDSRIELVSRYGQPLGIRGGRDFVGFGLFDADRSEARILEAEIPWTYATDSAYFAIHAQPIVAGRHFARRDSLEAVLAMIVETSHAGVLWGGADALGRRVRIGGADGPLAEVVGVVTDRNEPTFSGSRLVLTGRRQIYLSRWQLVDGQPRVSVRATSDVDGAIAALADAGAAVDPSIEVFNRGSLAEVQRFALLPLRLVTSILVAVAVFVHVLALVGLFALAGMRIADRRQELGVRLAVGAPPRSLLMMLVRDAWTEVVPALLIGTVLSCVVAVRAWQITTLSAETLMHVVFVSLGASTAALLSAVTMSSMIFLTISPVELLRKRY